MGSKGRRAGQQACRPGSRQQQVNRSSASGTGPRERTGPGLAAGGRPPPPLYLPGTSILNEREFPALGSSGQQVPPPLPVGLVPRPRPPDLPSPNHQQPAQPPAAARTQQPAPPQQGQSAGLQQRAARQLQQAAPAQQQAAAPQFPPLCSSAAKTRFPEDPFDMAEMVQPRPAATAARAAAAPAAACPQGLPLLAGSFPPDPQLPFAVPPSGVSMPPPPLPLPHLVGGYSSLPVHLSGAPPAWRPLAAPHGHTPPPAHLFPPPYGPPPPNTAGAGPDPMHSPPQQQQEQQRRQQQEQQLQKEEEHRQHSGVGHRLPSAGTTPPPAPPLALPGAFAAGAPGSYDLAGSFAPLPVSLGLQPASPHAAELPSTRAQLPPPPLSALVDATRAAAAAARARLEALFPSLPAPLPQWLLWQLLASLAGSSGEASGTAAAEAAEVAGQRQPPQMQHWGELLLSVGVAENTLATLRGWSSQQLVARCGELLSALRASYLSGRPLPEAPSQASLALAGLPLLALPPHFWQVQSGWWGRARLYGPFGQSTRGMWPDRCMPMRRCFAASRPWGQRSFFSVRAYCRVWLSRRGHAGAGALSALLDPGTP
jgi:hypothetical protein